MVWVSPLTRRRLVASSKVAQPSYSDLDSRHEPTVQTLFGKQQNFMSQETKANGPAELQVSSSYCIPMPVFTLWKLARLT